MTGALVETCWLVYILHPWRLAASFQGAFTSVQTPLSICCSWLSEHLLFAVRSLELFKSHTLNSHAVAFGSFSHARLLRVPCKCEVNCSILLLKYIVDM